MPFLSTLLKRISARDVLFAVALALAAFEMLALHALAPLENRLLDRFVRLRAATLATDPGIVIVDIDDPSLARMEAVAGKWPWPRSVHAELLEAVLRQHPAAVVFDIQFNERDVYRPDSDKMFNAALEGNGNVYFPMVRMAAANDHAGAPVRVLAPLIGLQRQADADPEARLAVQPPLALEERFWRGGTINYLADEDGVGRRYPLYFEARGWRLPSLPARVAADLGYRLPSGADLLLAWRGGRQAFRHISYADLYDDAGREHPRRPPDELAEKILIIGTDANGLNDLRATPVDSLYPGVQILATAIDNLKNGRTMRSPPPWLMPSLALILLLVLHWSFERGFHLLKVGAALAATSALMLIGTWWAIAQLWLLPTVGVLLLGWSYFFAASLQAYLAERKSRQQAIQLFSRFVNPHVVQQLVTTGAVLRAGESREVSVLFSDIRGFTTLSENRTPQEVVLLLNRYFTLQVEVIFRHGGSLDKFIGDCIMAFWGAPLDDPMHAHNAVLAALEMAEVLQRFKAELGDSEAVFDVGIGIHSGPAVVGLIGSDQRREYTAIGDTVNLASRIEGLTKGVARILVSQETMALCGGAFEFTPFGAFEVKGREQKVNLFEPQKGEKS
ncbi:MAG: adenylate/guanylate cyclase domain-containing protein [Pseudomonadota bacterium]